MKIWRQLSIFKEYHTKGLKSIKEVYMSVVLKKSSEKTKMNENNMATNVDVILTPLLTNLKTPSSAANEKLFTNLIEKEDINNEYDGELCYINTSQIIETEVSKFINLTRESHFLEQEFSTKQFWKKHKNQLPNLFNLASLLLGIPPSSAFIERYFSISGIVCNRRLSMNDDLVIERSLLKANVKILEELSLVCED
jgi:hypothetical protein